MSTHKDIKNTKTESAEPTSNSNTRTIPRRDRLAAQGFKRKLGGSKQTSSNSVLLPIFSGAKSQKNEKKQVMPMRDIYSTPQASFLLHNAVDIAPEIVASAKP